VRSGVWGRKPKKPFTGSACAPLPTLRTLPSPRWSERSVRLLDAISGISHGAATSDM
jgi:hypothetical protein